MRRKLKYTFMFTVFILLVSASTAFANDNATIKIDGKAAGTIPAPAEIDGVLLFPFAEIFHAAGYKVETKLDSSGVTATVIYTSQKFGARSGINHFDVFDETGEYYNRSIEFTTTPALIGEESVGVPLDYIIYDIGLSVSWDAPTSTLHVNTAASKPQNVYETNGDYGVYLKVNDPRMSIANYEAVYYKNVDGLQGTSPFVKEGRTLLPIATLIEALGGTVTWNGTDRKVSVALNGHNVEVWIDQKNAIVNGERKTLDSSPIISSGRTMVPIRFVTENLGLELVWDSKNQIIILYQPWFKSEMHFDSDIYATWFAPIVDETQVIEEPTPEPEELPQPNITDPLDSEGNLIQVGDLVQISNLFAGEVMEINGSEVLVFWYKRSSLAVDEYATETEMKFTAMLLSGVNWNESQWCPSSKVTIVGSTEGAFYN